MSLLPDRYLSPLHLPFNHACLAGRFRLAVPDADPGGPGVWLAVQGSDLLVAGAPTDLALPAGDCGWGEGLYLGSWDGRPCRLVRLAHEAVLPAGLHAAHLAAA